MGDMADMEVERQLGMRNRRLSMRNMPDDVYDAIDAEQRFAADHPVTYAEVYGQPAALTEVYGKRPKLVNIGGVMLPSTKGQTIMSSSRADSPDPRRELGAALDLRQQLNDRIAYLQDLVASLPPEPATGMVKLVVKFSPKGKLYEYLAIKAPDQRWFTTGAQENQKVFTNWTELGQWLVSDDVRSFQIIELTEKVPF